MIDAIKEICIFIMIAQAVLFFVPGKTYTKYVRVLVGVIMILKMTEPLFALVISEEKQVEMKERIQQLEAGIAAESEKIKVEDNKMGIYESMEKELKRRLEHCESDYEIVQVSFSEELYLGEESSGDEKIIITVSEKKASPEGEIRIEPIRLENGKESEPDRQDELKRMYGSCIGVDGDRIKIVLKE